MELQSFSPNHIDAHVSLPGEALKWRCTGFYGIADHANRFRSWELLRRLAGQSELAWEVGGDFNEILSSEEKIGGDPRAAHLIDSFRSALIDCSLMDMGFVGEKFTWSNNRTAPDTVRCRLDRVCSNPIWAEHFPDSVVEHLKFPGSDHVPILFRVRRPSLGGGWR